MTPKTGWKFNWLWFPSDLEMGHFRKDPPLPLRRKFLSSAGGWEKNLFLIIVSVLGHPKGLGVNFQFPPWGIYILMFSGMTQINKCIVLLEWVLMFQCDNSNIYKILCYYFYPNRNLP
jgi:hypothetical protein